MLVLVTPADVMNSQRDIAMRLAPDARAIVGNARDGVIEVLAPKTNKGAAIARIASDLGFASDAWAAIGDSQNDVEMMSMGALGLAMANCHPDTCAAADAVIGGNDTDAIAAAIRDRILSPECRNAGAASP